MVLEWNKLVYCNMCFRMKGQNFIEVVTHQKMTFLVLWIINLQFDMDIL